MTRNEGLGVVMVLKILHSSWPGQLSGVRSAVPCHEMLALMAVAETSSFGDNFPATGRACLLRCLELESAVSLRRSTYGGMWRYFAANTLALGPTLDLPAGPSTCR